MGAVKQRIELINHSIHMKIGPYQFDRPIILAPMAGVTDLPFRKLCRRLGADHAISEMVSSDTTLYAKKKSLHRIVFDGEIAPISAQIVGSDPQMMAKAAQYQVEKGAHIIDINMGCPAKKVCQKLAGSALLQDVSQVERILTAVVQAVSVPVTLKTRLGYQNGQENILTVAKLAEQLGIQALTIHGRTREDLYTGEARYELIAQVKQQLRIPVIANGDIVSPTKAKQVLEATGADAIMIGRAAQGNPWIFQQIKHYLSTGQQLDTPSTSERMDVLLEHLPELYHFYGEYSGCRIARKHISWYTTGLKQSNEFRKAMYAIENTADQFQFVERYLKSLID